MGTLTAKGRTGTLEVDDSFVTIRRKGVGAKMMHGFTQGEKRIPIHQITAVQYKKPGMTVGYIQFTIAGSNESTSGGFDAMQDENSVAFLKGAGDFEKIRDHVEAKIVERHASNGQPQPSDDLASRLKSLADLRDQGVLTDDEFDREKAKLLT